MRKSALDVTRELPAMPMAELIQLDPENCYHSEGWHGANRPEEDKEERTDDNG